MTASPQPLFYRSFVRMSKKIGPTDCDLNCDPVKDRVLLIRFIYLLYLLCYSFNYLSELCSKTVVHNTTHSWSDLLPIHQVILGFL